MPLVWHQPNQVPKILNLMCHCRQKIGELRSLFKKVCLSEDLTQRFCNDIAYKMVQWTYFDNVSSGYIDPQLLPPEFFCDRGGTEGDFLYREHRDDNFFFFLN